MRDFYLLIRRLTLLRVLGLGLVYGTGLCASLWLAYQLRFDFEVPVRQFGENMLLIFVAVIPLKLLVLYQFRQFDGLLSFFSIPDLKRLLIASFISSLLIGLIRLGYGLMPEGAADIAKALPRGVILTDFVLSTTALCAIRFGFRFIRERFLRPNPAPNTTKARKVAIVGAGEVGAALARDLLSKRWLSLSPVAFFDDHKTSRSSVHGIPVVGRPEDLLHPALNLKAKLGIEEVIIAMPSAPAKRISELVKIFQQAQLKVQTVPSMDQLATGRVKVSMLRPVQIEDLLGRASVEIETNNIESILAGRVVMVTGAGGSIGSELCRQIASFGPKKLLLLDRSEPQLFAIEQEFVENGCGELVVPIVADILDRPRLEEIFRQFAPNVLFHAAAHKHVPMMECQPAEAIRNNALGTARLIELATRYDIERFVLVSTDKAINPTSVMGATKRLAEIFLQSSHSAQSGRTKFMAVRFGNVLGSSGSVVPIFTKQIAAGGPVKVTHPEMTRYFMTIPEAASLVLQSAAQGEGGEIFVLDMGNPVKIIDLARQMIELSGLRPQEDIEIVFTGLRPGEKLFEELSHKGENITPTHHPKIMRFTAQPLSLNVVQPFFEKLSARLNTAQPDELRGMLKSIIPEYSPSSGAQREPASESGVGPLSPRDLPVPSSAISDERVEEAARV